MIDRGLVKAIDKIARELGFEVKRNNDNDVDFYLMDSEKEDFTSKMRMQ